MERRTLLKTLLAGALASSVRLAWAERLVATQRQTEGPFYPDKLPLDQDNNLVNISGHGGSAAGEVTDLTGRVLDLDGKPLWLVVASASLAAIKLGWLVPPG